MEEKEVRNYRVKERKTPDGRIQLTGSEDEEQQKCSTMCQTAGAGTGRRRPN